MSKPISADVRAATDILSPKDVNARLGGGRGQAPGQGREEQGNPLRRASASLVVRGAAYCLGVAVRILARRHCPARRIAAPPAGHHKAEIQKAIAMRRLNYEAMLARAGQAV